MFSGEIILLSYSLSNIEKYIYFSILHYFMQGVVKIYEIEDLAEAVYKIKRIPHLRVVLTPFCNMKCTYCRPGGEGYYKKDTTTIDTPTLIDLLGFCGEAGFRDIKFTDGEPMLRKDLEYIIK